MAGTGLTRPRTRKGATLDFHIILPQLLRDWEHTKLGKIPNHPISLLRMIPNHPVINNKYGLERGQNQGALRGGLHSNHANRAMEDHIASVPSPDIPLPTPAS